MSNLEQNDKTILPHLHDRDDGNDGGDDNKIFESVHLSSDMQLNHLVK